MAGKVNAISTKQRLGFTMTIRSYIVVSQKHFKIGIIIGYIVAYVLLNYKTSDPVFQIREGSKVTHPRKVASLPDKLNGKLKKI